MAVLLWSLSPAPAAADDPPHRPQPNYDGREDPPPDAGDRLIWIPRVVFFPVYVVTEYLIRWPFGKTLTWAERVGLIGRPGQFGFYPTGLIEFSFRPSIGIYFFGNDFPTDNDALRVHLAWGGSRWWHLSVRQRFRPAAPPVEGPRTNVPLESNEFSLHFEFKMRPDRLFAGIGPDAPDEDASRYFRRILGGHVDGEIVLGQGDGLAFSLGIEDNDLDNGSAYRGDPAIEDVFDVTDPRIVPGFDGYLLGYLMTKLTLDSRPWRPDPGTGARLEISGTLGTDFTDTDRLFVQYWTEMGVFLDVSGHHHTLSLKQYLGLVDNLGDGDIPFTELEILGGSELMRGFRQGRFHGPSSFISTLQYNYPIWVVVDGFVFFEVGNVFGENFDGFDFSSLASAFGMGLRTINDRDVMIGFLVGAGTDTFDAPSFGIEEVRFVLGVSRGF